MHNAVYLHQDAKQGPHWIVHIPTHWNRFFPIRFSIWEELGEPPTEFQLTTTDPYVAITSPKGIFLTVTLQTPETETEEYL